MLSAHLVVIDLGKRRKTEIFDSIINIFQVHWYCKVFTTISIKKNDRRYHRAFPLQLLIVYRMQIDAL
jgi:hypothetical protein